MAQKEFQDSNLSEGGKERVSNVPPSLYVKAVGTELSILRADSDEDAKKILQRQVRSGQTPLACVYKLMFAEAFDPSSVSLTPEQVLERFNKTAEDQI